jgi:hypothetical protein
MRVGQVSFECFVFQVPKLLTECNRISEVTTRKPDSCAWVIILPEVSLNISEVVAHPLNGFS